MAVENGTRLFIADSKGKTLVNEEFYGKDHVDQALTRYKDVYAVEGPYVTHYFQPCIATDE